MEFKEFKEKFVLESNEIGINNEEEKIKKFYTYMQLLLEWNKKINLTAITEPNDVIKKHFIDSLTIADQVIENNNIIDVGTGAGFPGIPLAIQTDARITLLDSLNKRINFLNEVKDKLELENVDTLHGRAEDVAQNSKYREKFDIATSRAVAPMNVLLEYLLPFVKIGGICICMKGPNVEEEMKNINKVLNILGGEVCEIKNIKFLDYDMQRNIIIIKKNANTPNKYPRKAGIPTKEPLI